MNYNILINYPSRGRPLRFKEGLDSVFANVRHPEMMKIFVKLDADDAELPQYEKILEEHRISHPRESARICTSIGESKNKIDAINQGIDSFSGLFDFEWGILCNFSDDMAFTHKNFDNVIRIAFKSYFPEGDGFPVFKDILHSKIAGFELDQLCTLSIMDKKYYERFHYIYNSEYISLYCDTEATIVSGILKRFVYIPEPIIFEHRHPANMNNVNWDERYALTQSKLLLDTDYNTFIRRQKNNFDLK